MAKLKASSYFQSTEDYFWQFEENGEVVAIPGGSTIIYKEHLHDLLKAMEWQGIPPFGGVMLAYIATGIGNDKDVDHVLSILSEFTDEWGCEEYIHIEVVKQGIQLVRELPERFKQGDARVALIERLTRSGGLRLSLKESQLCLTRLKFSKVQQLENVEYLDSVEKVGQDMLWVHSIAKRFETYGELMAWLEPTANFTMLVEKQLPELEPTKAESENLIQELCDTDSTSHIGWLVKRIWSGLNIPLHSSSAGEQPLGGISDLTNKGDFDKILLSEFANDDVLFMSRLANNEALYVRRETPPFQNKFKRVILIDNSVRTWGVPRTMGLAIALAITNHPKTDIPCEIIMLGDTYEQVELESPQKVLDALRNMSMTINPAKVLMQFLEENRRNSDVEYILISEPNVLEMSEMKAITHTGEDVFRYLFSPDYLGSLEIFKRRSKGYACIQSLQVPLDEMQLRQKAQKKEVSVKAVPGGLTPGNCPMLLGSTKSDAIIVDERSEVMRITKYGDVFRLFSRNAESKSERWELICRNLPSSTDLAFGVNKKGEEVLLLINQYERWIRLFNLRSCFLIYEKTSIPDPKLPQWCYYKEGIFYLGRTNHGLLFISADGHEMEDTVWSSSDFEMFRKRREMTGIRNSSSNVFSKIREVYITSDGRIGFNKHILSVQGGNYRLVSGGDADRDIAATASRRGQWKFVFGNGSVVRIDPAGFFALESSDPLNPVIFMTASVNVPIAVCTDDYFSGSSDFVHKGAKRFVLSVQSGNLNEAILSGLWSNFGYHRFSAEYFMQNLPWKVLCSNRFYYIDLKRNYLERLGLKCVITEEEAKEVSQEQLTPEEFQRRIVSTFISEILNAV